MIGADALRVTGKNQPLCIGGGKTVADLIGDNVTLTGDGVNVSVSGDVKHITGWTEFNPTVSAEQEGNYFPITLSAAYSGKPITVQRNDAAPKTAVDRNWILRIPSKETTFTFSVEGEVIFVLNFSNAELKTA